MCCKSKLFVEDKPRSAIRPPVHLSSCSRNFPTVHRLLVGILSAGLFCRNPLRLQYPDNPSGRPSYNTGAGFHDRVVEWPMCRGITQNRTQVRRREKLLLGGVFLCRSLSVDHRNNRMKRTNTGRTWKSSRNPTLQIKLKIEDFTS